MARIFTSLTESVEIGADVVAILRKLKERDEQLIKDLATALTGADMSDELKANLTPNQQALLSRFFAKLADEADLNEVFKALLSPARDLKADDPLRWTWTRAPDKALPAPGNLSFSLKGSADVDVRILPAPTYKFTGQLGISGSARAPFRFGSVGVSGSASRAAELTAAFGYPANTLLLSAMAEDLLMISDLNDLEKLRPPLSSVALEVQGEIKIGASLQAGKTFVVERGPGGSAVGAKAELGVGYTIDWSKSGRYRLQVSPLEGGVHVQVLEAHGHETARSLSIGAEVQFTNVKDTVAPLMKEISGFAAPVEAFVRKYADPSKLLQQKLKETVSTQDTRVQQLAQVITGQRQADKFVNDLTTIIAEEAGTRLGDYTDLAEGQVEELVDKVVMRLNLPDAEVEQQIRELAKKSSTKAINDLQSALAEELRDLLSSSGSAVTGSLSDFIEDVDALSNKLDTRARQLLAPMQDAIKRYHALQEKLSDAIEAIEKEKLAIKFGRAVNKSNQEELLIDLTLNTVDAKTKRWYRQMLTGDFSEVLRAALDSQNGQVTLGDSIYSRVFKRRTTTGVTINLFGLGELGFSKVLSSELSVKAKNGQIVVAKGSGDVTDVIEFLGETRTVRLSHFVNLLDADQQEESALEIYAAYVDEKLKKKELREHLMAFENRGLLAAGATERAVKAFVAENASGTINLTTVFGLSTAEVKAIAAMGQQKIKNAAMFAQTDSLMEYNAYKRRLRSIHRQFDQYEYVASAINALRGKSFTEVLTALGNPYGMNSATNRKAHLIMRINQNTADLVDFLSLWSSLKKSALPKVEANGKVNQRQFDKLEELNDRMMDSLDGWAQASGVIREFGGAALSPFTLAFLMVLKELTGRNEPVVPIISWTVNERTRRIAVV